MRSDGFTLVEMLVVLVLVGLMSILILDVFSHLKFVQSLQAQYEAESNVHAVAQYLADELEQALPRPLLEAVADQTPYLSGASDAVRFVAVTRTGFDREDLRDVQFSWRGPVHGLWRSTTARRGAVGAREHSEQFDKIDVQIEDVSFRYMASTDGWVDDWQDSKAVPVAIKISVAGRGPRGDFRSVAVARLQ